MNPVTSAGLTISLTLPSPERSKTVEKGILKGNWPGGLETPTEAENTAHPTESGVADLTGPVGEQPLLAQPTPPANVRFLILPARSQGRS